MSREPKLSLLSLLKDSGVNEELIRNKFTDREWYIYHGLANPHHGLLTSSIGRIFDAVASLLNLADINDYEGHAAILLESSAKDYLKKNNISKGCDLSNVFDHDEGVDMRPVMRYLLDDLKKGREVGEISAKFHITLVDIIERLAERGHFQYIAFSGGVFQNALLVDLIISRLSENYRLFFHKELSPNDENISFGQIAHHSIRQHVKGQIGERNFVEVEIN
jgi:hydrogenase maturation protein HypF